MPQSKQFDLGTDDQVPGFLGMTTGASQQFNDNDTGRGSRSKPWGFDFRSEFCLASPALLQGCTIVEDGRGPSCSPVHRLSGSKCTLEIQAFLLTVIEGNHWKYSSIPGHRTSVTYGMQSQSNFYCQSADFYFFLVLDKNSAVLKFY